MKWSRNPSLTAAALAGIAAISLCAHADLAPWMQSVVSGSGIEAALYRVMELPGLRTLYPRPPAEARDELNKLVSQKPDAELYALRAHVEEQSLDFTAAERDWKEYASRSQDKATAALELADYYHRRVQGAQEVASLEQAAAVRNEAQEKFAAADHQPAWAAFQRALQVAHDQALGDDAVLSVDRAWIARYPAEPAARAGYISTLLSLRRFDEAQKAIADYQSAFPADTAFPIKATAYAALQQGSADAAVHAIALFDKNYQPLWPADLIDSYFELLNTSHMQHTMLTSTQAQLLQHPDDLNAATRLFYFYKQEGRADAAVNVFAEYKASKESRHTAWTADELYTFARLLDDYAQKNEAAHCYAALAGVQGKLSITTETPEEAGLSGVIRILLTSPDDKIDLGSGNLSLYRDIATLDNGPGYLNGLLSLWLNSESPAAELNSEEQKATPFFHRAKAAELLAVLDQRYPSAAARPELHADLIQAYLQYGEDPALLKEGQRFLTDFPHAPQRFQVALQVADADARSNDTKAEYALYDSLLSDLGARLQGMPLTAAAQPSPTIAVQTPSGQDAVNNDTTNNDTSAATPSDTNDSDETSQTPAPSANAAKDMLKQAFSISAKTPETMGEAEEYQQVLERYLGRLTENQQLPAALTVLRHELDRNPNDPLLYEKLADFLAQNNFFAQEEEVYRKAMDRFHTMSFYDRLARFYLRQKRQDDHAKLTHQVVDIFSGTELESYFRQASGPWPQEALELNLYAHQRFPHDLMFTRNLLAAYQSKPTLNAAAWEKLIREHWMDAPDLKADFFDALAANGKLDAEMTALQALASSQAQQQQNPAATREMAEIHLWQSHFEASAPLLDGLARAYPADEDIATSAAGVFRSLAYNDPSKVERAAAIQKNLYESDPSNLDLLATIGDIYADSTSTALNLDTQKQLAQAAPYWKQMATVHPGVADGYLQSATVFWDYFQFDAAQAQITAARRQFKDPALYGYQAGAIYENQRDDAHAIAEYVAAAASGSGDLEARSRLLELATRKRTEAVVDKTTADFAAQHLTIPALELRAAVLTARHESEKLAPLVATAIQHATTVDDLAALVTFSQNHDLPQEHRAALSREISTVNDPVERIELQYQLVQVCEDQKDTAAARAIVESVYKSNPRIAGVVRSTVDFYWNNKEPQQAVTTLKQAAAAANSQFSQTYTLEAVSKSSASGDSAGARALLKPLLANDPFNAQYLSLEADSYAQAHDASGLRDFYLATIDALKKSSLSPLDKRDKIATARQGVILALTELKDYPGATDQHIALISAFPEDDAILQSATAYARLHSREQQLLDFLKKTVTDSPQDSRFAIDLARVDVQYEDYDGALAAYSKAIAIRKDRPDIYIARADLEEHQQNYDAACADYDRLYTLTYHDPQWMEKSALARARQGKRDLAVKALQAAWIDGRPVDANNQFQVVNQLAEWDMLAEAQPFLEQGVKLASDDLLRLGKFNGDAAIYATVMGRERKSADALAYLKHLRSLGGGSTSDLAVLVQQVEQNGIAAVTDKQWRTRLIQTRAQTAESTFRTALTALSETVAAYDTPEEKLAYAQLLDAERAGKPNIELLSVWIPAAHSAELYDRETAWKRDVLLSNTNESASQLYSFNNLTATRMDERWRGPTLDAYAATLKPANQTGALSLAAEAWRETENRTQEMRDLRTLVVGHNTPQFRDRYFSLLLKNDPAGLSRLAAVDNDNGKAAAEYFAEHGTQAQVNQAIASLGATRSPVWNDATAALFGLYYGDTSPAIDAHFQNVLADGTIGERLQQKPDPKKQLSGEPWFYYGMRYGVFLALPAKNSPKAEDYLPAELEHSPPSYAAGYESLADAFKDAGKIDAAIAEYRHVEELSPAEASPNIAIAELLWTQNKHDAAIAEWNHALAKLRAMVDMTAVPESFWTDFANIARDARKNALGTTLRPAMDAVLQPYIHKNGNYRSAELLHDAFYSLAKQDLKAAADWVLALTAVAPEGDTGQSSLLDLLETAPWFPPSSLDIVFHREISLEQARINANPSEKRRDDGVSADDTPDTPEADTNDSLDLDDYNRVPVTALVGIQVRYIRWLMRQSRTAEAEQMYENIPQEQRKNNEVERIGLYLAARQSRIPELLSSYENSPDSAPSLQTLTIVASRLRVAQDYKNSRLLLEYVFSQKLRQQSLHDTDYAALAEARLHDDDLSGAMDLLHRMTLQGDFYQNLDTATSLLIRSGHPAEALPMLAKLANGTPWNQEYRLRLAQTQLAAKQTDAASLQLKQVAQDRNAGYETRAEAAEALHTAGSSGTFDSTELTLLASGVPTAGQAAQPYYVHARIAAASAAAPERQVALLRGALLVAPANLRDWLRLQIFYANVKNNNQQQADVAIAPLLASNAWIKTPQARTLQTAWSVENDDLSATAASADNTNADTNNYATSSTQDSTGNDSTDDSTADDTNDSTGTDNSTNFTGNSNDAAARRSSRFELRAAYSLDAALADDAARLKLMAAVATVEEHEGDLTSAAQNFEAASALASTPVEKAQYKTRADSLQDQLALAAWNRNRRPHIQTALQQAVLVKPRLTSLKEAQP